MARRHPWLVAQLAALAVCQVASGQSELNRPWVANTLRANERRLLPASTIQPSLELISPAQAMLQPGPFLGLTELTVDPLIQEVLARHPSLAAAQATWHAAAARYPQVVSLEDPMLDLITAPGSIGARDVDFAYAIQARQKLPWPGKRPLRGQISRHESQAAFAELGEARVQLVQLSRQAYFEYFLARRLLELAYENQQAIEQLRRTALRRYESNLVTQQDVLLADVELAEGERRLLELARGERVAIARINTLLLRAPDAALPPPASTLPEIESARSLEALRAAAISQRPDLAAAWSRLRAEQDGVALAQREFKPDFELVGRYDTFWLPQDRLVGQVGVTMNVPLGQDRRQAAVREAQAKVAQRRAELDRLFNQVQFEVQEAYERLQESGRVLRLYRDRILPAATTSVSAAGASYQTGQVDFLRVVESQRRLIRLRESQVESLADHHRRLADLERAVGGL